MYAVGNRRDRYVIEGMLWPQMLPHPARDLTMCFAHAIAMAGQMEGQDGHVEDLAPRFAVGTESQETFAINPQLMPIGVQIFFYQMKRKCIVSGRDWSM